jgi:lipopolysaccharide/colanic/teichoic acid biosynthesis glycosyltransferase
MAKRTLDLVCSAFGLILLSPLFLLIACWIKMDSAGPVLFRQERVGQFGRAFRIHKFRTMSNAAPGPSITVGRDPRITRAGSFLRRFKLDELPQLMDVLLGDMSMVGPRPEVPRYVALYAPEIREKVLSVRPGITDETSLRFRNESELLASCADPEKFYVDSVLPLKVASYIEYVRTRSFFGDISILARTLRILIGR